MATEPNSKEPPMLATFGGKLQLRSFAFESSSSLSTPTSTTSLRRSPRNPTSAPEPSDVSEPATSAPMEQDTQDTPTLSPPRPSPSPNKRKASSSSSPSKRARVKSGNGYAPPSAYAHLPQVLPDAVAPNLLVLFVGLNPGVRTATEGHAYAHPTNLFWRLLHKSGVTPRLCAPEEDTMMPELYSLGLTNIVGRPSRCGSELSKREMDAGVSVLEEKARKWRPEVVCFVGKGIWESVERVWKARGRGSLSDRGKKFEYGWQDQLGRMGQEGKGGWWGARVFAATSTSGLAAGIKGPEKERIWRELGSWVERRRAERETEGGVEDFVKVESVEEEDTVEAEGQVKKEEETVETVETRVKKEEED